MSDVFCEVLNKHTKNKELCRKLQEKTIKEVDRLQSTGLSINYEVAFAGEYIIPFSLDFDSPLLCSAYSNYFGYCIQFDLQKLLNSFNQLYNISLFMTKLYIIITNKYKQLRKL